MYTQKCSVLISLCLNLAINNGIFISRVVVLVILILQSGIEFNSCLA